MGFLIDLVPQFGRRIPAQPGDPDEEGWEASSDSSDGPPAPESLNRLQEQLWDAIADLGGTVHPKFTWSCPKDALWLSTGNRLACTAPDEVLLLLRASDRVAHDVCGALSRTTTDKGDNNKIGHAIALRKWHDLDPSREFRVFVVEGALAGVSQRDVTQECSSLQDDTERGALLELISAFFEDHIRSAFPLPTYAFDVYVTRQRRVKLLDFNPPGDTTAGLLYSWEELLEASTEKPELRVVTGGVRLRPNLSVYGVPYDFVDDSEGSALQQLLDSAGGAAGLWQDLDGQAPQQQA